MCRSAAPCSNDGRDALSSARRIVAMVVTGSLAVTSCGGDASDRSMATVETAANAADSSGSDGPAFSAKLDSSSTVPATGSDAAVAGSSQSTFAKEPSTLTLKSAESSILEQPTGEFSTTESSSVLSHAEPEASTTNSGSPGSYWFSRDNLAIGYEGFLELKKPAGPEREDELIITDVTTRECVVRGTVYNSSSRLFARNVVVSLEQVGGDGIATWHWPLTMLPGEQAPFEIEFSWPPESSSPGFSWLDYIWYSGSRQIDARLNVTGELTETPDLGRAFTRNRLPNDGNTRFSIPQIVVHDERLYEYEDWDYWVRQRPYYFDLQNKERFLSQFPFSLVHSDDLDPIASEFIPLTFSNYSFTPKAAFPNVYIPEEHYMVEDIRAYQAILGVKTVYLGSLRINPLPSTYDPVSNSYTTWDVLDVRELVPFSFKRQFDADSGETVERLVAISGVSSSEILSIDPFYLLQLIPVSPNKLFPHNLELVPEDVKLSDTEADEYFDLYPWTERYYDSIEYQLWIGAGYDGTEGSRSESNSADSEPLASRDSRGQARGSCDSTSGLHRVERKRFRQYWEPYSPPLGTYGSGGAYPSDKFVDDIVDDVVVDLGTVTINDGAVRGLAQNRSNSMFARDVVVRVASGVDCDEDATWVWPLTVQPGERVPFEIEGCKANTASDAIEFKVTSSFSDRLDISRSFHIVGHNSGSIYGDDAEIANYGNYNEYSVPRSSSAGNVDRQVRNASYLHLLESEFRNIYPHDITIELIFGPGVLEFHDLYAKLESAVSHPSLKQQTLTQTIDTLKAYAAVFDSDMRVLDVKELAPFTTTHGPTSGKAHFLMVDSIPAASVWAPNSVRLLLTYPRENEEVAEICSLGKTFNEDPCEYRDRYRVWIGGAVEPLP